jgi:hypothetical protein
MQLLHLNRASTNTELLTCSELRGAQARHVSCTEHLVRQRQKESSHGPITETGNALPSRQTADT